MSDERCPKPGCGAQRTLGAPCTDWDCPEQWVHHTKFKPAIRAAHLRGLMEALEFVDDYVVKNTHVGDCGGNEYPTPDEIIEALDSRIQQLQSDKE